MTVRRHALEGIECRGGGRFRFADASVGVEDGIEGSFMDAGAEREEGCDLGLFGCGEGGGRGGVVGLVGERLVLLSLRTVGWNARRNVGVW